MVIPVRAYGERFKSAVDALSGQTSKGTERWT
jgi:hypothetical protein